MIGEIAGVGCGGRCRRRRKRSHTKMMDVVSTTGSKRWKDGGAVFQSGRDEAARSERIGEMPIFESTDSDGHMGWWTCGSLEVVPAHLGCHGRGSVVHSTPYIILPCSAMKVPNADFALS